MDDLHGVVVEQLGQAVVGARQAQPSGVLGSTLGRGAEQPADIDADAPQSLDMDRADEPTADHCGANAGRTHARARSPLVWAVWRCLAQPTYACQVQKSSSIWQ